VSAHSPAPWRVGPVDDTQVSDATGREIMQALGNYDDDAEAMRMEANARLCAAAPDMLAALKALVGDSPPHPLDSPGIIVARAAIARVESAP
jgi:hypothetical protein